MTEWTVRRATPDDSGPCSKVMRAALDGLGFVPKLHAPDEDWAYLAGSLLGAEAWVAEAESPVGYILVTDHHVHQLYVHPNWQSQGIGSTLLSAAKERNPDLTLHCFQQNAQALAFYAKHGFVEVGRDDAGTNDEGLPDVELRWEDLDLWGKGAAWMDGQVVPIADAKIGVTDWGVTRSDITYDVASVWDGAFFRLDDHIARFMESLVAMRLDPGVTSDDIKRICHTIVARAGHRNSYVSMVASRGLPAVHGNRDPRTCNNHFFAWCVPYVHVVVPEIADKGASLWVAKNVRRIPEDSVNPLAKNYHWGDITAGLFEAKDAGFETVVLLDHDGNVTEGPGFNVFAVKGDHVVTSDHGVLHGITRRTVLEMAEAQGLKVESRPLPLEEFLEADEIFLSSTGGGVIPITKVDDRIFSNGAPGPVATKLRGMYHDWRMDQKFRDPVAYA